MIKLTRLFVVLFALPMLAASCPSPAPTPAPMPITITNGSVYWVIPIINTDGTPLTDLKGFIIYWGTSSKSYLFRYSIMGSTVNSMRLNSFLIDPGTYYLSVTAFDSLGAESSKSPEVTFTAQ
jgi:hypothetical protein